MAYFIFAHSFNLFSIKLWALKINHFWGAIRTPILLHVCQEITNQLMRFKDDQEFGRTLLNRSSSWDLFFSERANLGSSQEPFYISRSNITTRDPWAIFARWSTNLLVFPLSSNWGDQRIMYHIWSRVAIRTWNRGVLEMHFFIYSMHSRD